MEGRIRHLDWMKGVAILCMVQVHTAAALPTGPANINHPLAFLAAAIGGMAAPLFVTASGFGIHISASKKSRDAMGWVGWIIPRALVLVLFQVVVNLLFHVNHGGSFHATTPGVLTLFAASAIIAPFTLKFGSYARASLLVALLIWPTLFPGYIGSDLNWSERIASDGIVEWSERLLLNGTYPLLPWFSYVLLGSMLADLDGNGLPAKAPVTIGLLFTLATFAQSWSEGIPWALTEGEAVLTFFPASTAFIGVSMTIVVLVKIALSKLEMSFGPESPSLMEKLDSAGRMSLTVYVGHFALLGAFVGIYKGGVITLTGSLAITLIHTLAWVPMASYYEGRFAHLSPEGMIRGINSRLSK